LLKVLVAEDNVVNQRVAILLLKQIGVSADLAADGAKAIEAVKANRYDLVLMDLQMPEVDGLAATKEIRTMPPAERQPLIYGLTAHATTEYRDICLAAGMDGYLTKPLDREKLWDLIEHLSTSRVPPCGVSGNAHRN
jgi:CheY-like chemotaxis protein